MIETEAPLLPPPPDIPGFWFRAYSGESDLPAIVELLRASDEANGEKMVASVDRVRNQYRHMTGIDPREDSILGFVGDRLAATSLIEWADTSYGERHFSSLGSVHPDWRRRGIGRAMAERNEARLRQIAASQRLDQTAATSRRRRPYS